MLAKFLPNLKNFITKNLWNLMKENYIKVLKLKTKLQDLISQNLLRKK